VLIVGWTIRLTFPAVTTSNNDAWGYLRPALTFSVGQGLAMTYGGSALYSVMISPCLALGGDLGAVVWIQRVASLLAAICIYRIVWRFADVPGLGRVSGWIAPVLAGLASATYFWSPSAIFYELTLRPESLCAAGTVLALDRLLSAIFARVNAGRAPWFIALNASLSVLAGLAACLLRPHALGIPFICAFALLVAAGLEPRIRGALLSGLVAALVAGGLALYSMHLVTRQDVGPSTNNAEMFYCIHADLIDMATSRPGVRAHLLAEYPWCAESLDALPGVIVEARKKTGIFPRLGFNADFIRYDSGHLAAVASSARSTEEYRDYLLACYSAAWWQPLGMLRKIGSQMDLFLRPGSAAFCVTWRKFQKYNEESGPQLLGFAGKDGSPRADVVARAARDIAGQANFYRDKRGDVFVGAANKYLAAVAWLVPLILGGTILVLIIPRDRKLIRRRAMLALVWAFPLSGAMVCSIAHALDMGRYLNGLMPVWLAALGASLVLICSACARAIPRGEESSEHD